MMEINYFLKLCVGMRTVCQKFVKCRYMILSCRCNFKYKDYHYHSITQLIYHPFIIPVPKMIFIPTYYVPELSSMESNC